MAIVLGQCLIISAMGLGARYLDLAASSLVFA